MALTDAVVRQARTTGRNYTLNDTDGLVLFVSGKGAKKWHFRFSWASKQQRVALGPYPELSLKQAREQRDELRSQLVKGIDPRTYRTQCKAETLAAPLNTFKAVFQTWRDFKALSLKTGRQSTLSQIDRIFARDVLPTLGKHSIFEVEQPHLLEVLRRIERRKAFTTAEKVRTWFNQMFRYAMVEKGLRYNPASDLDIVALPKPPVSHNPFLRMEEIPAFLRALRSYGGLDTTRQGLMLLLLTGVRTGELRSATPDQFDLERGLWIIPPVLVKQLQMKLRRLGKTIPPYIVPLPRQAITIVRQLLQAQSHRPAQRYLLPHRSSLKMRISENTLNGALHRMGYRDQLTGHGIRATISTALNELGYHKEWIEVQLSHADPDQIRAAYNHADYVEQRRMMMQDWADRLDRWESGEPVEKVTAAPQAPDSLEVIEAYLKALAKREFGITGDVPRAPRYHTGPGPR
ncbi:tyrosine-type recombinase/integrase [Acidovorax sp. SUPP2522]|nr:tyrosine-type recombinase/integrase [Acidovorax sp. SUPP2522]